MNKESILKHLKNIVHSAMLPSQVSFETNNNCLFIKLSGTGVIANMQTDSSAFEGWAVVLKAALPNIKEVYLDWEDPMFNTTKKNAQKAHYNRFLMRVANFKKAYTWFNIEKPKRRGEVSNMQALLDRKSIVINYPKSPCSAVTNESKKPEAVLERKLVKLWEKDFPITDEQLPVGLFEEKVSKKTTLTPRGASQIDLWQLNDNIVRIYELKVQGNESIGIISELMFYVCTIKHIIDGYIKYPDISKAKSYRHFENFANAVTNKQIRKVRGYFTAPKFHPLLERLENSIKKILNDNTFDISFEFKNISDLIQ